MKNILIPSLLACLFLLGSVSANANVRPTNYDGLDTWSMFTPETVVQKQLRAYNARDIEAFVSCFSQDVKVYIFPEQLLYKGKDELKKTYEQLFKSTPNLYCNLIDRSVNGNRVLDKVSISRIKRDEPTKTSVMYEVEDGLIVKMYFIN